MLARHQFNYRLKHQCGIALFTLMLFLQLWILMGFCALTLVWTCQKNQSIFFEKTKMHYLAPLLLQQIEKELSFSLDSCVIPIEKTSELFFKPLTWWHHNGCQIHSESLTYFYVIEKLGLDPCAYIQLRPTTIFAQYLRVSLRIPWNEVPYLYQSVYIFPNISDKTLCSGVLHKVDKGQQMSRRISHETVAKFQKE